jgi:heptosyltransferase-2/heptosyltransferase-3
MLGAPGAVAADLLMQLLGLAAIAFVLPIAIWGWRLITHRQLNRELASLTGIHGLHNVADDLPIPRLLALLERADGLLTVDSGPAHAAAAVGCPQVVLFGKALPSLYRPWGTAGADVQLLRGEIAGEATMLGIAAGKVIDTWSRLKLRGAASL